MLYCHMLFSAAHAASQTEASSVLVTLADNMKCDVVCCGALFCSVLFCAGNSCCLQMLPVCFVGIHSVRDTRNLRCFVVLCYTLYCYVRCCDLLLCDILCFVTYATYRMDTFCVVLCTVLSCYILFCPDLWASIKQQIICFVVLCIVMFCPVLSLFVIYLRLTCCLVLAHKICLTRMLCR
jgi:hypothetical protein